MLRGWVMGRWTTNALLSVALLLATAQALAGDGFEPSTLTYAG
jgi:hypothetical protein